MPVEKKQRTLLSSIRSELFKENIDAFIIGSGDAHQSEYVCDSDMRRQFISGFTGSAGTALILQDKALLWTDGRYFLQAEQELSEDWTLMKSGQPGVLEINDWLLANLEKGKNVGVDAFLVSTSEAKRMVSLLDTKGVNVIGATRNPVDIVWGEEGSRPLPPSGKVNIHDIALAGVDLKSKIQTLREIVRTADATSIVISMLDEVYNVLPFHDFKVIILIIWTLAAITS
jgi:Xaa-Pro aminopeptidase